MANKPVEKIRSGSVTASVWKNENEKDGKKFTSFSVSLQRGYKDKAGEWQNTDSLQTSDIPKAVLVLNKAYEYITMKGKEEASE